MSPMDRKMIRKVKYYSYFLVCVFVILCIGVSLATMPENNSTVDDREKGEIDFDIDPYKVREDGCPMVAERANLNLTQLNGDWTMPFASLNWLADIGLALFNNSVKLSQITTICPKISIIHNPLALKNEMQDNGPATWTLNFVYPKLHGEYELRCWHQNANTNSKFICWNDKENRDLYLMVSATDHNTWLLLARCSPSEPDAPSEGMSWVILSKTVPMDSDISDVLFGLLEGYGFDVEEFKTQLFYDSCHSS